jgi:hypothetical protein
MDIRGPIAALVTAGLLLGACAPRDTKSDAAAASTPPAATVDEPGPEKPATPLHFKQETADAIVSLDFDKAIERWPILHQQMFARDAPELKAFAVQAKEERDGMKGESFQPGPYARSLTYAPTAANARLVSVKGGWYENTGGAHPNHGWSGLLWDAAARRPLDPAALFVTGDFPQIQKALCDGISAAKKEKVGAADWDRETWPCPEWRKSKFVLAASTQPGRFGGLTFLFDPYELGAYAEGEYEVTLPWTVLKTALAPAWAGEFGGAPVVAAKPKDG